MGIGNLKCVDLAISEMQEFTAQFHRDWIKAQGIVQGKAGERDSMMQTGCIGLINQKIKIKLDIRLRHG